MDLFPSQLTINVTYIHRPYLVPINGINPHIMCLSSMRGTQGQLGRKEVLKWKLRQGESRNPFTDECP